MAPTKGNDHRYSFARSKEFTRAIEKLIPGGAHTYSRGRDQFPLEAPSGIQHGQGARVWDADNNEFVDWALGLGSVSLGHGYAPVVAAVTQVIQQGVSFQRPSQIEFAAAERFLALTGHERVKFARHGSSVTTAAVKLARAYSGRKLVAVPAEQPFFSFDDWFIGTTPCDFGVPDEHRRHTLRFPYGDSAALATLVGDHGKDLACIMLEPCKFEPPPTGYLEELQRLCRANGIVLVFDEMVSGLKMGLPGAQTRFGIEPDLTTWGKGFGNGFAIAALSGRADLLELGGLEPEGARKLFLLSSTHGGESVGFAALLATLDAFQAEDIVGENWRKGEQLRAGLRQVAKSRGLSDYLQVDGYPCLLLMTVAGPDGRADNAFRTLLLQEMIARGVLTQGTFFMTPSHGRAEIEFTLDAFDRACASFAEALSAGTTEGRLTGPPIKPVFRALK